MSRHREEFCAIMAQEGISVYHARQLMRAGSTLHRLAEDECNGVEDPRHYASVQANNARTTACGEDLLKDNAPVKGIRTSKRWAHVTCPSCKASRVEKRVTELCKPLGIVPVFQGDPRGAVVRLQVPSGRDKGWGGIAVP